MDRPILKENVMEARTIPEGVGNNLQSPKHVKPITADVMFELEAHCEGRYIPNVGVTLYRATVEGVDVTDLLDDDVTDQMVAALALQAVSGGGYKFNADNRLVPR